MATTKVITELVDLNQANSESGIKMPSGGAFSGTPLTGMMRNDTSQSSASSASTMQHYNGTDWKNFVNIANPPSTFNIDYLIVGGGGGGGGNEGAGGGAGQYLVSYNGEASGGSVAASPNTGQMSRGVAYTVTVGEGGLKNTGDPTDVNPQNWTKGFNGASSVLNFESRGGGGAITETAIGGGGGATGINYGAGSPLFIGADGASGGGGSRGSASYPAPRPGGSATSATTGYNGGSSDVNGNTDSSGGGGGAFGLGVSATSTGGFNGGSGATSAIDGTNTPRAGGGGGGGYSGVSRGTGASGGGDGGLDASTQATAGAANTGSGGGGGGGSGANTVRNGGDGGSGVVIIRYVTANGGSFSTSGTLQKITTTIGTDTIVTFTSGTGTITFN